MKARIVAVDSFVPHPIGLGVGHIIADGEYTSDLAVMAARTLFVSHNIDPATVDYLILCTQSPDYFLPTTACVVQAQIGLRLDVGAVDITLGHSGFIYALGLAKGLIESGQVRNVLVITAETHSKFANPGDKSARPIVSDGAAATLVVADPMHDGLTGLTLGTDGDGRMGLVEPIGGLRGAEEFSPNSSVEAPGLRSDDHDRHMDGQEIFDVTIRVVRGCVDEVLRKAALTMSDVDLFVLHQANGYVTEHLRKMLEIPTEKYLVSMEEYGNIGAATIPIALTNAIAAGRIKKEDKIMLVGFGVGLSWGGVLVTW